MGLLKVTHLILIKERIFMNNYKLSEVLASIQENQIFKVTYADAEWYITKLVGCIWYCDEKGKPYENVSAIPLTHSNLSANYQLI